MNRYTAANCSLANDAATVTKAGALAASFALFTLLALLSLAYLFSVGVAEAAILDGRMPGWLRPYAEAYSSPAHFAGNLSVVQIATQFGIDLGYDFADGPDTTR
jgi:hypothetical protein